MSADMLAIVLSGATLLVIAASAVAAIVQLRHLRTSNQLNALLEILEQWNNPTLQAAYTHFNLKMSTKLNDPDYIRMLERPGSVDRGTNPEFLVFDLWEQVGTYVKYGMVDKAILLDIAASQVRNAWNLGSPAIEILRRRTGPATLENFEYLAVESELWLRRTPNGAYPRGVPRMRELIGSNKERG